MSDAIRITDSHCHLNFPDFEGKVGEIVTRAADMGVHRMVTICPRLRHEPRVRAIAEAITEYRASLALRPDHASTLANLATLLHQAGNPTEA